MEKEECFGSAVVGLAIRVREAGVAYLCPLRPWPAGPSRFARLALLSFSGLSR
jgi:hypothetical protein